MALFDLFNYGSQNAIGVKMDYQQRYRNDLENEKMLNDEVSRIERDTKEAAERMKRVQLTTGKGVNQKLQTYYDGLTQQLKETISKNPNYKTDPFQMQQVNSVLNQYAENDIIANDQQSKASYNQFRELATKGALSAREIAIHEDKWKQYQDGQLDVFSYSKEHRTDYTNDSITAAKSITQLSKKNGAFINVDPKVLEKGLRGVFSDPEKLDQALADFRNEVPLEEKARYLNIPFKEDMTKEEEQELEQHVNERMKVLTENKGLADPVMRYLTDKFYPFTKQEYDQMALINARGAWSRRGSGKTPSEAPNYFADDVTKTLTAAREWAKANPEDKAAFNLKLNATKALFHETTDGMIVSDRMFIKSKSGMMIPMNSFTTPFLSNANMNTDKNAAHDGKLIVNKGKMRLAVRTQGFVHEDRISDFLTSMGFKVSVTDGGKKKVISRKNFGSVAYDAKDAEVKFLTDHLGAKYFQKNATGMGGILNSSPGYVIPYEVETGSDVFNERTAYYYDQEVYGKKKKTQLELDAIRMKSSGDVSFIDDDAPVAQ